jgi:hypothetical protein
MASAASTNNDDPTTPPVRRLAPMRAPIAGRNGGDPAAV